MGLTETGAQILSNPMPPALRRIGSPGVAVGNEIMIGNETQRPIRSARQEKFWCAVTMSCRAILISQKKLQNDYG